MECEMTRLCSRDKELASGEQNASSMALNLLLANLIHVEILRELQTLPQSHVPHWARWEVRGHRAGCP